MDDDLNELRNDPNVAVGTHVYHTSDDNVPFVPSGEIYVEWKRGSSDEQRNAALEELSLQVTQVRDENTSIVQVTGASPNPVKVAAALQKKAIVEVAEPELSTPGKLMVIALPNDPLVDKQWHLRNTGNNGGSTLGLRMGADARVWEAWERGRSTGAASVIVAVIDDGFDLAHPDLAGAGKQVAPWDFTRGNNSPLPEWHLTSSGELEGDWHGTACAGVAVGNANGQGIVGAAPSCRLMPVRWGRNLADSQIEAWFDHVLRQGAAVVSCSWSAQAAIFPLSRRTSAAITRCAEQGRGGLGTLICFAAGNENRTVNGSGSINGFAIHPSVIAVAACTSMDRRSHYSNFGKEIWISAPSSGSGGRGIWTSDVRGQVTTSAGTMALGYNAGDFAPDFGGTSSATPLVAGICALLLSIRHELTLKEVKQIIALTARKIGGVAEYNADGHSKNFGYGCINAAAAVEAVLARDGGGMRRGDDSGMDASNGDGLVINPAWGKDGHFTTNRKGVEAAPAKIAAFYATHIDEIERRSMEADHSKPKDKSEGPRHYIDIDLYGAFPFAELPEDYNKALAKFGTNTLKKRGLLPWTIQTRYGELVKAMKAGDRSKILEHSAWLGHYIGDSHVPLHTTENSDGQLTGQKGLHSHFESRMLQFVKPTDVKPVKGGPLPKPILACAFDWVRESYRHVDAILKADRATTGPNKRRDANAFAKKVRPIVIERLERGATRLASAWYQAWIDAGKPKLP